MAFFPRAFFALGALVLFGCATSTTNGSFAGDGGSSGSTPEGQTFNDLVVFTTKASFGGDLGGIAGADEKCNTYAKAAGLSGTFQAWLSDSSTDAISRVPEGGPWRVLDKQGKQTAVAFANRDAWTGYPETPIRNTEFGKELHDFSTSGTTEIPYTWTGTKLGGKKLGCHCEDWTTDKNFTSCGTSDYGGVIGSRGAAPSSEEWTNITSNPCDAKSSLLCYQLPN